MLWGDTAVGEDCVIGPNTQLTNVKVANGSVVEQTAARDTTITADNSADVR
jgi:bifunctional UDP-N-acetylglucosamine pyrophosphorylase/glucosamine-1-phosphate N-acetyltransferase